MDESSMVCVGGRGSSVCNGDSGGPLSCMEGDRWIVRGAASWVTSKTCPGHTYSVYARVSSYVNWINDQMKSEYCCEQSPCSHSSEGGGGGGGSPARWSERNASKGYH